MLHRPAETRTSSILLVLFCRWAQGLSTVSGVASNFPLYSFRQPNTSPANKAAAKCPKNSMLSGDFLSPSPNGHLFGPKTSFAPSHHLSGPSQRSSIDDRNLGKRCSSILRTSETWLRGAPYQKQQKTSGWQRCWSCDVNPKKRRSGCSSWMRWNCQGCWTSSFRIRQSGRTSKLSEGTRPPSLRCPGEEDLGGVEGEVAGEEPLQVQPQSPASTAEGPISPKTPRASPYERLATPVARWGTFPVFATPGVVSREPHREEEELEEEPVGQEEGEEDEEASRRTPSSSRTLLQNPASKGSWWPSSPPPRAFSRRWTSGMGEDGPSCGWKRTWGR